MMLRAGLVLLAVLAVGAAPGAHAQDEEDVAGTVTRLKGAVVAMHDAVPRVLEVGSEIFVGDVISTGHTARVELRMIDEGVLSLGARTVFNVIDYTFKDIDTKATLRLISGSFRALTGKIAEASGGRFQVATEVATIGVRGTDFWGGGLDGHFQVALLGGKSIVIENRAGRVEITEVGAGTTVRGADVAPTPPKAWSKDKIGRAAATVAFD
jgi:hypothetical protein